MMKPGTTLRVERIPIAHLLVEECKVRYGSMVMLYVEKLLAYPHDDAGFIKVRPSTAHRGLYTIDDGHHRYVASIIAGRKDMLCIVIEEP